MSGRISFHGHSGCGKDTACHWFVAHTDLRFAGSTSWFLAPIVAERLGIPVEWLRDGRRHRYAEEMFRIGNEVRGDDPGFLVRPVLERGELVAGVRDPCEIDYMRTLGDVLIVWIDRDVPVDPTMRRYGPEKCDIRIDNRGTLDEFHARLEALARFGGIKVYPRAHAPL